MKQVTLDGSEPQSNFQHWSNNDMDKIETQQNYMIPIFDKVIADKKVANILDLGCGNGYFTKYFKKPGTRLVGVDGSEYGLKNALKAGFDECWSIEDFNKDTISLSERFDLIICKDVLEHLLFPDVFLRNATHFLKENGVILVQVPNHFTLFHRLKFLFTSNIDTQGFFKDADEWNNPHIRFFTDHGMRKMFNSMNLRVDEMYTDQFYFIAPFLNFIFRKLKIEKYFAKKFPNQFSIAFTYKLSKKNTSAKSETNSTYN